MSFSTGLHVLYLSSIEIIFFSVYTFLHILHCLFVCFTLQVFVLLPYAFFHFCFIVQCVEIVYNVMHFKPIKLLLLFPRKILFRHGLIDVYFMPCIIFESKHRHFFISYLFGTILH